MTSSPASAPAIGRPSAAMRDHSALEVRKIGMHFDRRPVLRDISLRFEPGRVHGLVGHNGSGKSTLIKVIAGFHRPTSGGILLDGKPVPLGSPNAGYRLGLRFVHQDLGLAPQFDALENFGLGAGYSRTWRRTIDWAEQQRRLHAALAMLQAELPDRRPIGEFTPVQRTLLAIARSLATGTDGTVARYLMLDEPTTALEGPETEQLFQVVRRLTAQGVGVLYVSHQLDDICELSDTVTVLRDGRIVESMPKGDASHARIVRDMLGEEQANQEGLAHSGVLQDRSGSGGQPVISVRGLRSARLRGVDFAVGRGECVCAVGLSGSGREELVYALAGAVSSSATSIEVQGRATKLDPARCGRERIALVPGNRLPGSIVGDFTIQENLAFASLDKMTGPLGILHSDQERRMVDHWIDRFDILPKDPNYRCRHLSGGNKQKVIMAKWLAIDPLALLIDEPTAGVDVGAARTILSTLRSIADDGKALLVTTSEVSDVFPIADRLLVFNRGHLVRTMTRDEGEWTESSIVHAMTQAPAAMAEAADLKGKERSL